MSNAEGLGKRIKDKMNTSLGITEINNIDIKLEWIFH